MVFKTLICILTMAGALAAADSGFDYSAWQKVLTARVSEIGEVDYEGLKQNPGDLNQFLDQIAKTSPKNHPELFPAKADQLAYWINAYNALTISGVLKAYPVKSVRYIGIPFTFFSRKNYVVGGEKMSVDNIEHDILRKDFAEPRIHFAVVCASVSCPRIQREAYTPANVFDQLERGAKEFVAERRNVEVQGDKLILSSILNWYGKDFSRDGKSVNDFLKAHAAPSLAAQLDKVANVSFRDYDWNLNQPGSRAKSNDAERELAAKK